MQHDRFAQSSSNKRDSYEEVKDRSGHLPSIIHEQSVRRAHEKCAVWLVRYVFDHEGSNNNF